MNDNAKLAVLASAWQSENESPRAGLARLVRRQSLWIRLNAAIELLISAAFLSGSLWAAIRWPQGEFIALAIGLWMLTLTALIYSLSNRAGTWVPESQDTRSYLALSVRRARTGLRAVQFAFYLLAVEVVLLAAWQWWYWHSRPEAPGILVWVEAACLPMAFLAGLLAIRERQRRQLARLEELEHELTDESSFADFVDGPA